MGTPIFDTGGDSARCFNGSSRSRYRFGEVGGGSVRVCGDTVMGFGRPALDEVEEAEEYLCPGEFT